MSQCSGNWAPVRRRAVKSYRAYQINSADRIVSGTWIEAVDDAAARRVATTVSDDATPNVELWEGSRYVDRLTCGPRARKRG